MLRKDNISKVAVRRCYCHHIHGILDHHSDNDDLHIDEDDDHNDDDDLNVDDDHHNENDDDHNDNNDHTMSMMMISMLPEDDVCEAAARRCYRPTEYLSPSYILSSSCQCSSSLSYK